MYVCMYVMHMVCYLALEQKLLKIVNSNSNFVLIGEF